MCNRNNNHNGELEMSIVNEKFIEQLRQAIGNISLIIFVILALFLVYAFVFYYYEWKRRE